MINSRPRRVSSNSRKAERRSAARYTPPGGTIALTAQREGDVAAITVRDNGSGIEPAMLSRVFELFHRGSEHNATGGLGIGLAIARRLVEMHGGTIQAQSAGAGQGSAFTVRLPLTAARTETPAGDAVTLALPPQRILVVDDNLDSAQSLALLLAQLGAEVRMAHDGAGALREASAWRPDVMLLDIGMPDMDGYEVARRLRADQSLAGLRIVAVTGWGQEEDRRMARDAGIDHHLTKPVQVARLTELLRRS